MKERIFGIETEFGLEVLDENGKIIIGIGNKTNLKKRIIEKIGIRGRIASGDTHARTYQPNGSRIYKDIGEHIEYSTPECRNVRDLVIFDKAGENIIHKMASQGTKQKNIKEKLIIYKNNTDSTQMIGQGRTWGCHENYLVPTSHFGESSRADIIRQRKISLDLLIPFLVTRQIYSGAGWFFLNPRSSYVLSQRTPFVSSIGPPNLGYETQSLPQHKQMITIKGPFGKENFKRLEIRVGESNLAEWSTYLKIGTTAIVLRMIEDDFLQKHLSLNHYNLMFPLETLKEVAKDITCKKPNVCFNGRYINPIEVQKNLYLEPAKIYLNRYGANEEEKDVMEKWNYVLEATADNPLKKLSDRLDVWIRLKLFSDYMKKYRTSWSHWKVGALNLAYGDIDKERSVFCRLQELGRIKRIVADSEIQLAETNPPNNTRARLRGLVVGLANKNNWYYNIEWDKFIRTSTNKTIPFPTSESGRMFSLSWPDPFQFQDEKVDKLIEKFG